MIKKTLLISAITLINSLVFGQGLLSYVKWEADGQEAEKFDPTLPENRYPIFGGALNGKPNSNTFVDNVIENSGGKINDFTDAKNQNAGE